MRTWTEGKRPLKDTAQLCRGEANGQTGTLFRATWETLSTRATGENAAGIRSSLIGSPPCLCGPSLTQRGRQQIISTDRLFPLSAKLQIWHQSKTASKFSTLLLRECRQPTLPTSILSLRTFHAPLPSPVSTPIWIHPFRKLPNDAVCKSRIIMRDETTGDF